MFLYSQMTIACVKSTDKNKQKTQTLAIVVCMWEAKCVLPLLATLKLRQDSPHTKIRWRQLVELASIFQGSPASASSLGLQVGRHVGSGHLHLFDLCCLLRTPHNLLSASGGIGGS